MCLLHMYVLSSLFENFKGFAKRNKNFDKTSISLPGTIHGK